MEQTFNKDNPIVRLRAFRAIDDPDACKRFVEGHANVLTSIGITKVTSSKNEWIDNPGVFVLTVESLDGQQVYGGARVHVSGGSQLLPIEEATSLLDASIHNLVNTYAENGTGEICGLWNSKELSGYGIGSPLLIRTGIAITSQIGLQSLFALCAPYTVKPVVHCGMELESSIGNEGTFYYPKLDLLATTMLLKDVTLLSKATEEDRNSIIKLRENLNDIRTERIREKEITIHYNITIPNLQHWNLRKLVEDFKISNMNLKLNSHSFDII